MKKLGKYIMKLWIVLMLFGLVAISSCEEAEKSQQLLSTHLIEGKFSPSRGMFTFNGEDYSDKNVVFEFTPFYNDSTFYNIQITGVIPSKNRILDGVVKVHSTENEILFDSEGQLDMHGSYIPKANGEEYQFSALCNYQFGNPTLRNTPFVVNFTKKTHAFDRTFTGNIVFDGVSYSRQEMMDNLCSQLEKLYAKSDSCVQLLFKDDCTLDICMLNNINGRMSKDNWMTIKYWPTNYLTLEFTREQAEKFVAKWLDKDHVDFGVDDLFYKDEAGRYAFDLGFSVNEHQSKRIFWFDFTSDFRLRALYLLMNGRLKNELNEEEWKKIQVAYRIMAEDQVNKSILPFWHSELADE